MTTASSTGAPPVAIVPADQALRQFVAQVAQISDLPATVDSSLSDIVKPFLDAAWQAAGADADAQGAIEAVWNTVSMIGDMATRMTAIVAGASDLMHSMAAQRDKALDELHGLVKAVQEGDYHNPLVRDLAQTIVDEHDETFWESLPYDLGSILGMDYYDADLLYTAITLDTNYEFPDVNEHGVSADALESFRSQLRDLLEQLRTDSYAELAAGDPTNLTEGEADDKEDDTEPDNESEEDD